MYIWEQTNWPDFTFNYNELAPHLESVRRQQMRSWARARSYQGS